LNQVAEIGFTSNRTAALLPGGENPLAYHGKKKITNQLLGEANMSACSHCGPSSKGTSAEAGRCGEAGFPRRGVAAIGLDGQVLIACWMARVVRRPATTSSGFAARRFHTFGRIHNLLSVFVDVDDSRIANP